MSFLQGEPLWQIALADSPGQRLSDLDLPQESSTGAGPRYLFELPLDFINAAPKDWSLPDSKTRAYLDEFGHWFSDFLGVYSGKRRDVKFLQECREIALVKEFVIGPPGREKLSYAGKNPIAKKIGRVLLRDSAKVDLGLPLFKLRLRLLIFALVQQAGAIVRSSLSASMSTVDILAATSPRPYFPSGEPRTFDKSDSWQKICAEVERDQAFIDRERRRARGDYQWLGKVVFYCLLGLVVVATRVCS